MLNAAGYSANPDDLCDAPFRPKHRLRRATRFSDGSFPVFYSSLDIATADSEMRHWFPYFSGDPQCPRTAYYQRFSCIFDGQVKDLRPKLAQWPNLVHESDYTFCNRLGAEAVQSGLDGLVTPSARRKKGTNLPVFKRKAVHNPQLLSVVSFTLDPATEQVTMR